VDLERYLKQDSYGAIKISPTGEYYAAVLNLADQSLLVIQRRADGKITAKAGGRVNSQIADFWWVNDHRVMVAMAEKFGSLDQPLSTGELFGVNVDGSKPKMLIGASTSDGRGAEYQFIENPSDYQYAELIDTLPRDPQNVLVAISGYDKEPLTRVARMDVDNGRLSEVATAPVKRASFASDADGVVRFAEGKDRDNFSRLLYRDNDKSAWRVVNDERSSKHVEWPLGFSADGKTAYLQVQQSSGPDAIVAFDTASGTRTQVLRDRLVDPDEVIYAGADFVPVGASFVSDRRRTAFFDEQSVDAQLQRTLEKAFPGDSVRMTSRTQDGQLALLLVSSDTNPGDFLLFNLKDSSREGVFRAPHLAGPEKMAPTRSVEFAARDGLVLHGYLTMPKGGATGLPMVVLPHGGLRRRRPMGLRRGVAAARRPAGYAVLRVNYRGSGNYGRAFMQAGAKAMGQADAAGRHRRHALGDRAGRRRRQARVHLRRELWRLRGDDGTGARARAVSLWRRLRRRLRPAADVPQRRAARGLAQDLGRRVGGRSGSAGGGVADHAGGKHPPAGVPGRGRQGRARSARAQQAPGEGAQGRGASAADAVRRDRRPRLLHRRAPARVLCAAAGFPGREHRRRQSEVVARAAA
jgi:dipeptidyl aminopeptidase/acylaminoacyl peptidase